MPTTYLLRLTLLEPAVLAELCHHYNLALSADRKAVHFNKTEFKSAAETVKSRHESFVDSKLKRIYLPEVLLLKKLWI